jgi:hypothetical protein
LGIRTGLSHPSVALRFFLCHCDVRSRKDSLAKWYNATLAEESC